VAAEVAATATVVWVAPVVAVALVDLCSTVHKVYRVPVRLPCPWVKVPRIKVVEEVTLHLV
jgi:hypothetical protein